MDEKVSKQVFKETQEMVQWRSINQQEIDSAEEAVGENCGRSTRQVQIGGEQEMSIQRKRSAVGVEDGSESQGIPATKMERRLLGRELLRGRGNTMCSEGQGMQESKTEEEDIEAAAKGEGHHRRDKENQDKKAERTQITVGGVSELLATDCKKIVAPPRMGKAQRGDDTLGCMK